MKRIWKGYRVEIILLVLALTVLFLLFEPFGIHTLIQNSLRISLSAVLTVIQASLDRLVNFLLNLTVSEMTGLILVCGAIAFVIARIRSRYRNNPEKAATVCPKCSGSIRRVHRTQFDRLLGKTLLPNSRRYRCMNPECDWSGLRHPRNRSEHTLPEAEVSQIR